MARILGIKRYMVPKLAAGLSAYGGLLSDVRWEESATLHQTSRDFDPVRVARLLRGLRGKGDAFLAQMGFEPAIFFAWSSFLIEGLGGIGIILGLFTRFFAAAVAIEMGVIFLAYWNNGFGWMNRGYEYVLLWGLVSFAIALRGGGPYSLDRKLGIEL